MKIQSNNTNNTQFKAKIALDSSASDFWEKIAPANLSSKKSKKVVEALETIGKHLHNDTIILSKKPGSILIATSEKTGLEIANQKIFANWPNFIIKTAKKFTEQFIPLAESMKNVKSK